MVWGGICMGALGSAVRSFARILCVCVPAGLLAGSARVRERSAPAMRKCAWLGRTGSVVRAEQGEECKEGAAVWRHVLHMQTIIYLFRVNVRPIPENDLNTIRFRTPNSEIFLKNTNGEIQQPISYVELSTTQMLSTLSDEVFFLLLKDNNYTCLFCIN